MFEHSCFIILCTPNVWALFVCQRQVSYPAPTFRYGCMYYERGHCLISSCFSWHRHPLNVVGIWHLNAILLPKYMVSLWKFSIKKLKKRLILIFLASLTCFLLNILLPHASPPIYLFLRLRLWVTICQHLFYLLTSWFGPELQTSACFTLEVDQTNSFANRILHSLIIWLILLSDGYRGDWLKLLLCRVCLEESYFPPLFSMFSTFDFPGSQVDTECRGGTHFNMEQAFLLGLLSEILSEHHLCRGSISSEFALAIFHILREASAVMGFFSRVTTPLPTGSPMIDVLGYSLTILRDVCALDDCSAPASDGLVDSLVSSGLCPFLLALLHDLEPPSIIRRTLPQRANRESPSTYSSKVCPYKGFRRDVVAVIGNCTCGRKHVQDEIRQQNGILLLLQQCVIDEDNPYLREWGMLTVSYLLEGNMENQQQIAELEFQGSIDMPEITSLGLRVDVDKKSSRVKLVNV